MPPAAVFAPRLQNPSAQPTEEDSLQPPRMANMTLSGVDGPGVLPVWPFSSRDGPAAAAFVSQVQHPEQRGHPAPQWAKPPRRVADFSIRSLLAPDGSEGERENQKAPAGGTVEWSGPPQDYAWISCSCFKPPFVPKMKRVGSPRPTSRSPRVPFSAAQLGTLENSFQQTRYLSTGQVRDMALLLGLTENRVKIWFQNRRARERRDFLKQHPTSSMGVKGKLLQDQPHFRWR